MAAVPNIVNMIAGINQRKRAGAEREALANYLDDPAAALEALAPVNPEKAIQLDQMQRQQELAAQQAKADRITGGFKYLRGLPEGTDLNQAMAGMGGFFKGLGYGDDELGAMQQLVSQPGFNPAMLDDDAWEAYVKDQYTTSTMTPGSHAVRGGKVIHEVPYQMKTVTTRGGDGSARTDVFDPNTGLFLDESAEVAAPSSAAGPGSVVRNWTVDDLFDHFVAQESNDDYTAVNSETGALGRYQIMPDTGRNLAKRAGVAWRPDLMKQDSAAARKYQDALGRAAIQEAVDYGNGRGGNLDEVTGYYYAGPNRKGWGPRTRQYQEDMRGRVSGSRTISMPGRPPKERTTYRRATAEELRGYPDGTAAQIDSNGKLVNIKVPPKGSSKAAAGAEGRDPGKAAGLSDTLAAMADQYIQLDERNAIRDTDDSMLSNLGNRLAGSAVGQMVGQAVGTESQSLRDSINNSRPLLMSQIREATGMSSRSMDSNKELEFYLQAVSNPGSGDIISNLAALAVLDNLYGNGSALKRLPPELRKRVEKRSLLLRRSRPVDSLPKPIKVGDVRKGYRLVAWPPSDKSNWEKVQ